MSQYTQANRPLRLNTVLDEDALLIHAFSGVEAISSPYSFRLSLASEDPQLSATDILRTPVTVTMELDGDQPRWFSGIVNRFVRLGENQGLALYEAEVVPWLWFLGLSRDCRIFQNMTVLEIAEEVFSSNGFSDYDIRCVRSYPPREYAVQYRETHLNFISRLLEDEAIFYFFEHTYSGHVMVLSDDNSAMESLEHQPVVQVRAQSAVDDSVITGLRVEHSVQPGRVTLQDYDFEQPEFDLLTSMSGDGGEEIYDFHPGRYRTRDNGSRYARLTLEALEAGRQIIHGQSDCRAFAAGFHFELEGHRVDDLNQEYGLIQVSHSIRSGGYRSASGDGFSYQNQFRAIPHDMPYCPPRSHQKPVMRGCQTALVVGPANHEIWTDSHGRIKVQFHWDRLGQENEDSSCWIRVGSPWAGKNWGSITIPRIGNEVIVDFLEGDPDRPIVIGSVYNGDQPPPVDLPDRGIQMGMRTRSSPDGGGHNEIMLSDDKGNERIAIQAEHDMSTTVEHDQSTSVGNDQSASVGNDRSLSVGNDRSATVGNDSALTIGHDQKVDVGHDQSLSVSHDQTVVVANDQSVTAGTNRSVSVGSEYALDVGTDAGLTIGGDLTVNGGGSISEHSAAGHRVSSDGDIELTAKNIKGNAEAEVTVDGQKVTLKGLVEVKLEVGANFVKVDASGVTIMGTLVKIN